MTGSFAEMDVLQSDAFKLMSESLGGPTDVPGMLGQGGDRRNSQKRSAWAGFLLYR
jgi:hypothetical protein